MLTPHQNTIANAILKYAANDAADYWCVSPEAGKYMYDLILKHGLRYGVECGSGIGYSTLWLASAFKKHNGTLLGFEFFEPKNILANDFLRKAKLGSVAEVLWTSATKGIPHLKRGVDFVFLDARKMDYLTHFLLLRPKLKKDAVVVADNVLSHPNELKKYLDYVRKNHQSTLMNIGTGLEVTFV